MTGSDVLVPQFKVLINNKELSVKRYRVMAIDVNLSDSANANDCQIVFAGMFDFEYSKMGEQLLSAVIPGKKVEVKLGYKKQSTVFMGYINSTDTSYSPEGVVVTAHCLDARGLLMKRYDWKSFSNQTYAQIVQKLLSPLKPYVGSVSVNVKEPSGDAVKETPKVKDSEDDYSYIVELARLTKSSFRMIGKKLEFVPDSTGKGSLAASYKWGRNIIALRRRVDLYDQIEKVIVHGKDPDTQKTFSASSKPISGGKTGAKLSATVKEKVYEIESNEVKTQEQAQILADSIMIRLAGSLVSGMARVLGNPELTPGSKVKFSGFDDEVNGTYDIKGIHHQLDEDGFLTDISFGSCYV